jgi:shikimate 5-dehydrogenase
MSEKRAKLSRRNFVLTMGAGGAAATAAAVMTRAPAVSSKNSDDKRATAGYQASEHVNNYYRTTKV